MRPPSIQKFIIAVFACMLFYGSTSSSSHEATRDILSSLSIEESRFLEGKFAYLFSSDFGYTLIGEKPCSIDDRLELELVFNPKTVHVLCSYLERIFKLSDRYFFYCTESDNYSELILVNKQALDRVLKNNQLFLQQRCGRTFSVQDICKEIELHFESRTGLIFGDSVALGVILGYGISNSLFFIRKCELGCYLKKYPYVCLIIGRYWWDKTPEPDWDAESSLYQIPSPILNPNFSSLEEEWRWIVQVDATRRDSSEPPILIKDVEFIAMKGAETERLSRKYDRAKEKLGKVFSKKGFLHGVLDQISQNN